MFVLRVIWGCIHTKSHFKPLSSFLFLPIDFRFVCFIFYVWHALCVLFFFSSPHSVRVRVKKNSCMDRHYCPYCRVNMIMHLSHMYLHAHTEVVFLRSQCLVPLLLWLSEVKWLRSFNQQLTRVFLNSLWYPNGKSSPSTELDLTKNGEDEEDSVTLFCLSDSPLHILKVWLICSSRL